MTWTYEHRIFQTLLLPQIYFILQHTFKKHWQGSYFIAVGIIPSSPQLFLSFDELDHTVCGLFFLSYWLKLGSSFLNRHIHLIFFVKNRKASWRYSCRRTCTLFILKFSRRLAKSAHPWTFWDRERTKVATTTWFALLRKNTQRRKRKGGNYLIPSRHVSYSGSHSLADPKRRVSRLTRTVAGGLRRALCLMVNGKPSWGHAGYKRLSVWTKEYRCGQHPL